MYRDHTKVIRIGDRKIGGGNPVLIQSMTNTKTENVEQTVAQILALEQAGCDIIRCAVPTMEAAKALKEIKKQIHIPLVADIHFDYRLAIAAMENGADKIRINPGNIGSTERIKAVVDVAKERNIPIRVGVNSGSLEKELVEKYHGVTAEGLVESALDKVHIIEELGYDNLVGGAVVYIGVATGFAAAMTNPFSVGIAQTIADVPLNSGVAYRAVIFAVFEMVSIWYVMRYARKVKQNPELSVLYGCDEVERSDKKQYDKEVNFTFRRKLCTILFFATIGILLYGTSMLGWYIDEISSLFLAMMVVAGVVGGSSLNEICLTFIESTKSVVSSILVIGFTRGILIVMKEALISDTIVYYLSSLLDIGDPVISAIGMLFLQSIINIFINGSSSQATITMPIMAPVADIVGVSRQTAVLAYCFGDGFSDMFWPTNCSLECGLMGIPLERWYKFITPLFLIMTILQVFFIALSVCVY